jgi:hypothetical protein
MPTDPDRTDAAVPTGLYFDPATGQLHDSGNPEYLPEPIGECDMILAHAGCEAEAAALRQAWQAATNAVNDAVGQAEANGTDAMMWRDRAEAAEARAAELERERDHLRLQAETWAQEARTQRATVHKAYQAATGATGEPGDWHGAGPVEVRIAELGAALAKFQAAHAEAHRCAVAGRAIANVIEWCMVGEVPDHEFVDRVVAAYTMFVVQTCGDTARAEPAGGGE